MLYRIGFYDKISQCVLSIFSFSMLTFSCCICFVAGVFAGQTPIVSGNCQNKSVDECLKESNIKARTPEAIGERSVTVQFDKVSPQQAVHNILENANIHNYTISEINSIFVVALVTGEDSSEANTNKGSTRVADNNVSNALAREKALAYQPNQETVVSLAGGQTISFIQIEFLRGKSELANYQSDYKIPLPGGGTIPANELESIKQKAINAPMLALPDGYNKYNSSKQQKQ